MLLSPPDSRDAVCGRCAPQRGRDRRCLLLLCEIPTAIVPSPAATHKPFKAAATTAHRRSPVHAAARPQQQQLEQETHATSATLLDRRSLLLAVGAALAGAAAQQILPPAAAAAEDACEYTTAVGGLQFCDLVEGSGDPPVQGTVGVGCGGGGSTSPGRLQDLASC